MEKKHIVVGVTGGIASYKALEVVSKLKKLSFDTTVILTKNACEFIQPLSFQIISQNLVYTDMFEEPRNWEVEHIELAKKADAFLIVPATANIIGKVASGIADDLLSTTIMATKAPVIFAPSMNSNMYNNPIFRANVENLESLGYIFIRPFTGKLACGDEGIGKLPDPEYIVNEVMDIFDRNDFSFPVRSYDYSYDEEEKKLPAMEKEKNYYDDFRGKRILVTAGPTVEAIDPVRFISNHSSGKMGFALAEEAAERGAEVLLITGPVALETPRGVQRIDVTSTEDMYREVHFNFDWADIVIKAAAPADYRPEVYVDQKIKKASGDFNIKLTKNPDILKSLGEIKGNKLLIGFAAESNNLLEYARGKVENKNLDFIVANNILESGSGFKGDTNHVTIIDSEGKMSEYNKMTKKQVAHVILDKVKTYF
ncbi:MAG: bifunctional phosphopantothenoylcysteine decarboxylase/phosphopantothenate--cysteine ligase CoaBC [Peptostreptococcales bacterium]